MISDRDIYEHLKHGGSLDSLHKAFAKNIDKIQKQIEEEAVAAKKEKELAEKKDKARIAALKALKSYLALVNPNITEDIIDTILSSFELAKVYPFNSYIRRGDPDINIF